MIFSSFTFLLFFMPLTILLYRVVPAKARMPLLLATSLLFYGWSNPLWLLLLFFSMVINWAGAQVMMRSGERSKAVFLICIVFNLLP